MYVHVCRDDIIGSLCVNTKQAEANIVCSMHVSCPVVYLPLGAPSMERYVKNIEAQKIFGVPMRRENGQIYGRYGINDRGGASSSTQASAEVRR